MAALQANASCNPPTALTGNLEDIMSNRHFIGIPEAATYLGVAEKTIRGLIRDNRLPAYRLGYRVIKIRIEDLETVLSPVGVSAV